MQDLKNIIESLLFVSDEPLTIDTLRSILDNWDTKQIKQSLEELCVDYDARGGGFHLREVAGGWQLRSRAQYHPWIKRMLQPSPQRLSRAALETLAIIAYKQPIIRADIEHIRGVDSGGVLRQLMERKLVRVLGRKEIPGRPLIYATTKLFLELFDLKDLNDLPTPKEIQELSAEFGRQDDTNIDAHNPPRSAEDQTEIDQTTAASAQSRQEKAETESDSATSAQTETMSDDDYIDDTDSDDDPAGEMEPNEDISSATGTHTGGSDDPVAGDPISNT